MKGQWKRAGKLLVPIQTEDMKRTAFLFVKAGLLLNGLNTAVSCCNDFHSFTFTFAFASVGEQNYIYSAAVMGNYMEDMHQQRSM